MKLRRKVPSKSTRLQAMRIMSATNAKTKIEFHGVDEACSKTTQQRTG